MTHRRPEDEKERLAAALRANLARRKSQARERAREEGDTPQRLEGLPTERHVARLRPTEGPLEPGGPGAAAGEGSHDSAGFVGDKP
jgi:hypothetical protein